MSRDAARSLPGWRGGCVVSLLLWGLGAAPAQGATVMAGGAGPATGFPGAALDHDSFVDADRAETVDTFLARLTAWLQRDPTLDFNESFETPSDAALVEAATAAAQAALLKGIDLDPTNVGPALLTSTLGPIGLPPSSAPPPR